METAWEKAQGLKRLFIFGNVILLPEKVSKIENNIEEFAGKWRILPI